MYRYGAFPSEIIKYMWRAKQPYNVSVASETAALAAISNPDYMDSVRQLLIEERERLYQQLEAVPFLQPFPSHANFILCQARCRQLAEACSCLLGATGLGSSVVLDVSANCPPAWQVKYF
jgi:histidinol-phosphate aminotransferase